MKKQSNLSRLLTIAGSYRYLTYASWILSAISALIALVPYYFIWQVMREVLEVAPDFSRAQNLTYNGWMAVMFAVIAVLVYIAGLMCSHLGAFRIATNLRLQSMNHIVKLPLGFAEHFGSGKLRKIVNESSAATETYLAHQLPDRANALATPCGLLVLLFVFDLFGPLKALYGEASRLTVMNAALDRIEAVLNEPELPDTGKQHLPAQAQPGQPEVQFNDVVFAYQDKEVLHHISFAMKKDSMTALVGPSGSGKSTIANLLARLWDVKSGSIIIRGMDIRNVPLAELMEQISFVFQEVRLFKKSIRDNIRAARPDATEAEILHAAQLAQCSDILEKTPGGLDAVIGAKGVYLSGGEMQRIALARAILKDAPIVVLDEASSFADPENEAKIQKAFEALMKGKTVLMIAHRLSTVRNMDRILVIRDGEIAEEGKHDELLEKGGVYAAMWEEYQKAAQWKVGGAA